MKGQIMRTVFYFFLMTCILSGISSVSAQVILPGPDALGLYFDEEALNTELAVEAGASYQVYLILTNPTMNAIEGWESAVILTNGNSVTTTEFPAGSQPLLNGPQEWAVSMTTAMPCNVLTKLAVFTGLATTDEPAPFYLGNISVPSQAGDYPGALLVGGDWIALDVASGDPALPVAGVNGGTPNETSSWGAVKSLFR